VGTFFGARKSERNPSEVSYLHRPSPLFSEFASAPKTLTTYFPTKPKRLV
jgi:hypothetical protein